MIRRASFKRASATSTPRGAEAKKQKQTIRLQLQGRGDATGSPGKYEILFIKAGEANGWTFSRQVLEESANLWEEISVFVDHSIFGRSVRDLAAVLTDVQWSDEHKGLTGQLSAAGPSKEILTEAAETMLSDGAHPDLGFSADLIFTADAQNNVQKIMQPLSVDLVIDPAFATKFIRQLNSKGIQSVGAGLVPTHERSTMKKRFVGATPPARPPEDGDENENDDRQFDERSIATALLQADANAARETRVAMSNQLLEVTLSNSELGEAAQKSLRAQFENKPFKPADLTAAVKGYQDAIAEATAGKEIVGPHRVSAMFDSGDQLQAAIDDLIGAPREKAAENLKVAKFNGVKEAYIHLTGDRDFVGGYFRDRVQFQHTTANFPGLVANALNKALVREWAQLGRAGYDWWNKIATVEHFSTLNDIAWLIFGTAGSLPTVAEGAEYPEIKIGDGKETSSFVKKGGYVGITLEALDRDDTRKLRAIPRELANAGLREISALVAAIFTDNSAVGPTLADTGALFNNTAVTTKGGHANLLTTAIGADFVAWEAVAAAMYNQPMLVANETGYYGTGKKMAIEPKYCLVPRALKAQAEALFIPRWASTVEAAIAVKGGPTYGGYVEPITVPEWTDATDWAAVADPAVMPGIMIGERFGLVPQIFVAGSETDPAMFSNDESRIKVRHFVAVGVADFRPLHKENV